MLSIRDYASVMRQKFNAAGFYTSDLSHNYAETSFEVEKGNSSLICSLMIDGRILFKDSYWGLKIKFESNINCPIDVMLKKLEVHFVGPGIS